MALSLQLFPQKYCYGNKYIVIHEWPPDKLNRICYPGVYFTSCMRYYFYVGLIEIIYWIRIVFYIYEIGH